nr:MFS transporter [Bifidobacterium psychraerophilum]
MYFYTDVFGLPAESALGAGTILLVARFADAISAPIWGSIVDHTQTKWGRADPGSCGSPSPSPSPSGWPSPPRIFPTAPRNSSTP